MESAACRRRASDSEQSARWTYSATAECEPVAVKEEPEWGECGVSEAAAAEGLYVSHEVKVEVVIEQETVQQQDVAFSIQKNMEYYISNDHTYSKKPHCEHPYEKLESESRIFLRKGAVVKTEEGPCQLQPAGGAGAAPECTHTRPGEGPRCNMSHNQQSQLRSCSARVERILMEDLPVNHDCKSSLRNRNCKHSVEESNMCKELAVHQVETESERMLRYSSDGVRHFTDATSINQSINLNQSIVPSHKGDKPFSCDFCKSQFKTRYLLTRHTQIHTGEKPFSCDICKSRFTCKSNLAVHRRTHTAVKPLSCDVCKSQFKTRYLLSRHTQIHTGEKPFSCDICESRFTYKSNLAVHRRTHTGVKPFACDVCKSRFGHRGHLITHKRTHTGEKPFACEYCESRFADRSSIAVHRRTHTGEKPFSCDVCKSRFKSKSYLAVHKRTHTGEKPFACDYCDCESRFADRSALAVHRRTHTGEKRYSCDVCKSRFVSSSSLAIHRRTHTGETPFSCDVCKSRFRSKRGLTTHVRTHTG